MKEIIDNAILELKLLDIEPSLIRLSDFDYERFILELRLERRIVEDDSFNDIHILEYYNGVQIVTGLPDIDEVPNPLFSESFICSDTIYQKSQDGMSNVLIKKGRGFNIRTLEEILKITNNA